MRRSSSLLSQVLAVNVLLVTATLFAASLAAGLDITIHDQRRQFLVLALAILLTLLVNVLMLRRRFSPLEQLIETVEKVDPAHPSALEIGQVDPRDDVGRLASSFQRLLERIDKEQRRSGRVALRAQEEERKRVARDLHDEVNQALTAILLRLEALSQDAPPGLAAELAETKRLANQAMEELLQLARQLRPSALDDHGLVPAIEDQVKRFGDKTGIQAQMHCDGDASHLTLDQETVVYRVAQEALTNVARHSRARHAWVELSFNGATELSIRDDGHGFQLATARPGGLGLGGMAERARLVGGELTLDSAPGTGTTVTLRVP